MKIAVRKVRPGRRYVTCTCHSFTIGRGLRKFSKGIPQEVTEEQFQALVGINQQLGRVVFKEHLIGERQNQNLMSKSMKDIFAIEEETPKEKSPPAEDTELLDDDKLAELFGDDEEPEPAPKSKKKSGIGMVPVGFEEPTEEAEDTDLSDEEDILAPKVTKKKSAASVTVKKRPVKKA